MSPIDHIKKQTSRSGAGKSLENKALHKVISESQTGYNAVFDPEKWVLRG